jgi:predicted RNA binding protein YcfA (HicA-like mRNA interferase family)
LSSWRKLLREMLDDPKPVNYTYEDCTRILLQLGYILATRGGTSHRKWRHPSIGGRSTIGLLDTKGCIPREYVIDMLEQLKRNNLIPDNV